MVEDGVGRGGSLVSFVGIERFERDEAIESDGTV